MNIITKTKVSNLIFLFVLLFPFSKCLAQNPIVSLSGGPCTGSTLTVTSSATPTQVAFLLNGSAVSASASLTYVAAAAGTYTATVTTATGSATTSAVVITAYTTPSIVISSIPGSNICQGTNVNLTATATFTGSAPTYQWKNNGNPVGANSPTLTINTLANGDVINCTLTSNAACASPSTASSNNITYTVNATLTPSVSISAIPGNTICSGNSVSFIAAPVNGGTSPAYQWYVNNTLITGATNDTFTTTTLNNNDAVYCKMVTSVPCPTVETVTSNTVTMSVSISVTPSINVTVTPGNTICSGTLVTFTAATSNSGSNPQYQWYRNGTAIPAATSTTYSSSLLSNYDSLRCTMTSNAACATATLVSSNEEIMMVNQTGTPSITIASQSGTSVCVNDTVIFTAITTLGGSAPLYTWKKNSTVLANQVNMNTISITGINNNDTISCILTSNQSCATANTANSNSLVMMVNPHVTMTLSITANPGANITAGDVVTFIATATNTGSSFGYQWYVNGIAKTGSISPTYSSNTLANHDVVTSQVTTSEPCVSSPIITSNPITMNVSSSVAMVSIGAIVNLYPNPNKGTFTIKGTIIDNTKETYLEICNLIGQVVYRDVIATSTGIFNHQIQLPANVANGFYMLKLKANNSSDYLKFSVNK